MQEYNIYPIPFPFDASRIDATRANNLAGGLSVMKWEGNKKVARLWETNDPNLYVVGLEAYGKTSFYKARKSTFDTALLFHLMGADSPLSSTEQNALHVLQNNGGILHPTRARKLGVPKGVLESLFTNGYLNRYTAGDTIQHIYFERNPKAGLAYELKTA